MKTSYCLLLAAGLPIQPAFAVHYPEVNAENFPSGIYDDGNPTSLSYWYFIPPSYDPLNQDILYPLVVYLHGAGERGDDGRHLNGGAGGSMIFISSSQPDNQADYPCFYLAPQCSSDSTVTNWSNPGYVADQVAGLVGDFVQKFPIDPDRIYITGNSMGGGGTFAQVARHPNRYAAAVPLAGWGDGHEEDYVHIPLWAFHAADDGTVPVSSSDAPIAGLRAAGGDPIYTRLETGGHGRPSQLAYSTGTPLVPWVMAQRRGLSNQSDRLRILISSPTAKETLVTDATIITCSGQAEGPAAGITAISWQNTRTGSSGPAEGIQDWSVNAIGILNGINPIRITATAGTFTSPANGTTTLSRTLKVIPSSILDTALPEIAITSPASSGKLVTTRHLAALSGTATDNLAIATVAWSNDRGGSGWASGDNDWRITDIDLFRGNNVLTVTAMDYAGNVAMATLEVIYEPELIPPKVVSWEARPNETGIFQVTFQWLHSQTGYIWQIQSTTEPLNNNWSEVIPVSVHETTEPSDPDTTLITAAFPGDLDADRSVYRIIVKPIE